MSPDFEKLARGRLEEMDSYNLTERAYYNLLIENGRLQAQVDQLRSELASQKERCTVQTREINHMTAKLERLERIEEKAARMLFDYRSDQDEIRYDLIAEYDEMEEATP